MMFAAIEHWQFWELFMSKWCCSAAGAWIVASFIKMIIAAFKTREFDFVYLVSTGGMPSSHSAFVSALAFSIGYTEGFDTPIATFACGFAVVTMFDAATVRHAAGEHAKVLNSIVHDILEFKFKPRERFKELLGHTRLEVLCGMLAGIAWATAVCHFWD